MTLIDRLLDLAALPPEALPEAARARARQSLFDWMVCGRAGAAEPVAGILRGLVAAEGGAEVASVIGGGLAPARAAALVNGAASHALDYDDTHFAHVAHPSVAIYPAALAAGEAAEAGACAVADAFLVGAEGSIRVGLALGRGHYDRGFHQTATAGAFGATLAAGRLLGLGREELRAALGLCATRAAGLKSQFGTMGKPYNAGIAAATGVECAMLAGLGMTSADDGLAGPQGFLATHSDAPDMAAALAEVPSGRMLFEEVKYKLHACCHGTHAMIEGLGAAMAAQGLAPGLIAGVRLRTHPRWLKVCDIRRPRTGLEVKFSYVWLAAMVRAGLPTASERVYTDALAADAELAGFAAAVEVAGDDSLTDMQAAGEIVLATGGAVPFAHDLAAPLPPEQLEARLRAKAASLLGAAEAERLWQLAAAPGAHSAADLGAALRAG